MGKCRDRVPCVYKILCTATGDFYIGSARDLPMRKTQHINALNRRKHCNKNLQAAWLEYGPLSFRFEVLQLLGQNDYLSTVESLFIDRLKPAYNINILIKHKHVPDWARRRIGPAELWKEPTDA